MGTIVCQSCSNPIAYFENKKVSILYANSNTCKHCNKERNK